MPHVPASTALARFRVLDLSRVRAGPTCVRQLADFGADVIKIETPPSLEQDTMGGPRHGPDFQNLHRNKRSITLNLKDKEGVAIFMKLAKTADVVVENYRPDVKFRLGIDYESLKKVNPRIILASISGFGQDGPYRDRPGFDQIAQGMGGFMSITGLPGQGPVRAGTAIADLSAGLFAALGIMTALLEREKSGEGQWVQANLLMSQIALLDFQAARFLMTGKPPGQAGNDHPTNRVAGLVGNNCGLRRNERRHVRDQLPRLHKPDRYDPRGNFVVVGNGPGVVSGLDRDVARLGIALVHNRQRPPAANGGVAVPVQLRVQQVHRLILADGMRADDGHIAVDVSVQHNDETRGVAQITQDHLQRRVAEIQAQLN